MRFHILRPFITTVAALLITACVDLTGLEDLGSSHLTSITVEHGGVVEAGDTIRLTAAGSVDGILGFLVYDPVLDARWTISDPAIGQLQALPLPAPDDPYPQARTLVRGLRPGTVTVTASARGLTGQATVRVAPAVATIQVWAVQQTFAVGDTIVVAASAADAGGVPIEGLSLTFEVAGGLQTLFRYGNSLHVVAIATGPAIVSVHSLRATAEFPLVVVERAP